MHIETLLAHLAEEGGVYDPYGASHLPIYQTATFDLKKQSGSKIYDYTRSDNPTRDALETVFAKAENGASCSCTHTGIGAIALLFETVLKSNSKILVEKDCYGGTYRLLQVYKDKYNIEVFFADFTDLLKIKNLLETENFDLVLCESPTNPGMKIIDIRELAKLAKSNDTKFAVDNSLATFASQKPLDLGADFSVFSATKYISGHGSTVAGALVSKSEEDGEKVAYFANAEGRSQNPFDVFLISLGIPTLPLRLKHHEQSAIQVSDYLEKHSKVNKLVYPGSKNHPQHELAKSQMKIFPGVLTVHLQDVETAEKLVASTRWFGEKASFGTADSRIEIPAKISHASFSKEDLLAIGIYPSTVRLSIGLEHIDDLLDDLENALK